MRIGIISCILLHVFLSHSYIKSDKLTATELIFPATLKPENDRSFIIYILAQKHIFIKLILIVFEIIIHSFMAEEYQS